MSDFWATVLAEIKALGLQCFVHGPEFWLGLVLVCVGVIAGLLLAALLAANGRDDDNERH